MMYTIKDAEKQLDKLMDLADKGEDVVINRPGKSPVRLVTEPAKPKGNRVKLGLRQLPEGTSLDLDVINAADDEIARMFNGENEPIEPK